MFKSIFKGPNTERLILRIFGALSFSAEQFKIDRLIVKNNVISDLLKDI